MHAQPINFTFENLHPLAFGPRSALQSVVDLCERGRIVVDGPHSAFFELGDERVVYELISSGRKDTKLSSASDVDAAKCSLEGAPTIWEAVDRFSDHWAAFSSGKDGWKLWWRKPPQLCVLGLYDQELPLDTLEDAFGEVPNIIPRKQTTFAGWSFAFRARVALTAPTKG